MIAELIRNIVPNISPMVNPDVNGQPLPFTFYTGTLDEINRIDNPSSPCIVLPRPIVGRDILHHSGVAGTNYQIKLFYFIQSRLDMSMAEREAGLAKLIKAKDHFTKLLIDKINSAAEDAMVDTTQLEFFGRINSSKHEEMFNEDDANLDGIVHLLDIDTAKNTCSFFLS